MAILGFLEVPSRIPIIKEMTVVTVATGLTSHQSKIKQINDKGRKTVP